MRQRQNSCRVPLGFSSKLQVENSSSAIPQPEPLRAFEIYIIPSEMSDPDKSILLHSRVTVDLEDLLKNPDDVENERAIKIDSLAAWDVPLVICTVDQVLGIIRNNRRPLFTFPCLATGAFVFDEIHQYDDRLFRSLLRFIEVFSGAPILLMTASLPAPRLSAIHKSVEMTGNRLEIIEGPVELYGFPRYKFEGIDKEPPCDVIVETIRKGQKIFRVAKNRYLLCCVRSGS